MSNLSPEAAYQEAKNRIEEAIKSQDIGLDLSRLGLATLPPEIGQLTNLQSLDLSFNQLSSLPYEISKLINLQKLYLIGNLLGDLPLDIGLLTNLRGLFLGGNQLRTLPPEIGQLTNLQALDLSNNQLRALPSEIGQLTNLLIIGSGGNPLEIPPSEIAERGISAIREYFKSLEGEKQSLNEVKVILVGDGYAGKTSLVKQLLKLDKFDPKEPQTHGIKINHWDIKKGKDNIKVHLWDFGGQEIMHATHQFFLSKRSLYVLVLDSRKDDKTEYWLKHIESFGGNSPILVVINKIDENPGFDVNRPFLQDKYKGIKGFYRVSCANGTGLAEFSAVLSKELTEVEHIKTLWPKSWFKIKTNLEKMKENFIDYEKYLQICQAERVTEKESQEVLVDFLNDLGTILHFKDFELDDTHVLEPKWVTQAVYKIINSEMLAKSKGVLKLSNLDEILQQKNKEEDFFYPRNLYPYIIKLMVKFKLCYQLKEEMILIPDLLEVQESKFDFDYNSALKSIFKYNFLPRSIMPQFIVEKHHDIKDDLRWRTGVVLESKGFGTTAVIKADNEEKKIYVYVNGKLKRDYFATIRHTFLAINNSFEKLPYEELIPCNCKECSKSEQPHYHNYESLVKFRSKLKDKILCPTSAEDVSVNQLLEGIEKSDISTEKEMLSILRELRDKANNEETYMKAVNDIFEIRPNIPVLGITFNFNEFVKKIWFDKKK